MTTKKLNEFTFRVTQPCVGYFKGEATIKAKNAESAIKKLSKLSQRKLDELCDGWELSDGCDPNGKIKIEGMIGNPVKLVNSNEKQKTL